MGRAVRARNMALPYDAIAPEAGGLQARKMSRARAVGATMAIAMVGCVALLGITGGMNRTELVIKTPAHTGLNMLANHVLREGGDMTVPQLAKLMQNWRPAPSSEAQKLLAQGGAKTQMLSGTMLAAGDSRLCDKKEYEKYRQAAKEAKENYLSGLKKHDIERQELFDERELIKVIMRYIGVLHDVKATEKSIAAGGR